MKTYLYLIIVFIVTLIGGVIPNYNFASNSDTIIYSNKKNARLLISDTTYSCLVVTLSKKNYKKVYLSELTDSSVIILEGDYSHKLIIDSIQSITFYGRGFMTGAAIGGGIGMALGLILGGENFSITGDGGGAGKYNFGQAFGSGFVIGIPFAVIGGTLGGIFAEDKFYDLSNRSLGVKREMLSHIMKKYSDK